MFKNKFKKLIVIFVAVGLFAFFSSVLAQNFGTNEISNGLNNSLGSTDPRATVGRIINISLGLLGVIAVGIIMWGGFVWMTSGGEEDKIRSAQTIIRNGVIGLVIILSAWGITLFILSKLGGAISGSGNGGSCLDGATQSCGCGGAGSMYCSNGSWSGCVGGSSDCSHNNPTSCNSNLGSSVCAADNNICAPQDYCDNSDCLCKPKGNVGDPCDANLKNATCDPDNNLCGQYLTCNASTCLCFGPPVITQISPVGGFCNDNYNKSCTKDSDCGTTCNLTTPNGTADNFITIFGKSFGTYSSSTSRVVFEGAGNSLDGKQPVELNPACINTWQDNEIIIAVPSGVSSGPIKVINKDNLSDETNDNYGPKIDDFIANSIVRPGLCSLNPDQGYLSAKVDYQGFNLYLGNAYFGNYQSNVSGLNSNFSSQVGLSGTSYIPNIQAGPSGSFVVNTSNGNTSNYLSFTKDQEPGVGPYIISFSPSTGTAGQYVTIRGKGFGSSRGTSHVYFSGPSGDTEASYDFPDVCLSSVWKDDQIIVKVPDKLLDKSDYLIKIKLGTTIIDSSKINPDTFFNDNSLDLLSGICKIDPSSGPATTPVGLWGENFGLLNSEALVKFSPDQSATGTVVKDGRADFVKTSVPDGSVTGPVKVIKKDSFGNTVNFTVGSCKVNSDCGGTQVCCPSGTYRAGRCFDSLEACSSDSPTSVYEWSFSTSFDNIVTNPYYSCADKANTLGACQVGATCPNTPGSCSPYAGGQDVAGKICDLSCASIPGCSVLSGNNCSYSSATNKCVKSITSCDLPKTFSYVLGGKKTTFPETCNADKHWEFNSPGSCPGVSSDPGSNWIKISGGDCVNLNSTCSSCDTSLTCETQSDGNNRCVSAQICPSGSQCEGEGVNSSYGTGRCISKDQATCSCCCTIGNDKQDCCSYVNASSTVVQLTCGGSCGSGAGLGKCGGCASAPDPDSACNCTGHSGQYCDVSNAHPQGVCSDCTSLADITSCSSHATCCFDSKKTATSTDDFCRGGNKIGGSGTDAGYCAYYNCQTAPGDPKVCATSTPVKLGFFNTINQCTATSTGCPSGLITDPCSLLKDATSCLAENNCCFDKTAGKCQGGNKIPSDPNGYCAYFNCSSSDSKVCDFNATSSGAYISTSTCSTKCPNPDGGAGLSCFGSSTIPVLGQTASTTCAYGKCTFPGFACLTASSTLGALPDCGSCCCQPGTTTTVDGIAHDICYSSSTPLLHCQADQGNCSGAGRGLCCGCTKDSDCGSVGTTGCGSDSCCQARPQIESVTPKHLETGVCRNTIIQVGFDQQLDVAKSLGQLILIEEKNSGTCDNGLADNSIQNLLNSNTSRLARIFNSLNYFWHKLIALLSNQALAAVTSSSKIYCKVPGNVQSQTIGKKTSLIFSPTKLLDSASSYYIIALGDEQLNSQTGVISSDGIGFNGNGYNTTATTSVAGGTINFNNKYYINSQISKFTTSSGTDSVCQVDHVAISPDSYLFTTTENDLNEKDTNPQESGTNFDTVADKDKVFVATAYSADGEALQPVTTYFWNWDWKIDNTQVATITPVDGLEPNKAFVSAQAGVVDDSTKISATVDTGNFSSSSCTSSASCVCTDSNCSSNCCNKYFGGGGTSGSSDLYVFICQNPWPPIAADGSWKPWNDNCDGLPASSGCANYNYKFYYCRDAGDKTTLDDLPAIIKDAVTQGPSKNLVCSSDHSSCSSLNSPCGADNDNNSVPDGICIWDVLKESYFFRETVPQGGHISDALDNSDGTSVTVTWQLENADAGQAASYKIYYNQTGAGADYKPVPTSACSSVGTITNCSAVVTGLKTGVTYSFKVSLVSGKATEGLLSGVINATPTDKTPPAIPIGLTASTTNDTLVLSWKANSDKVSSYILYHGVYPLNYGDKPSPVLSPATSKVFDYNTLPFESNYYAISAVDDSGNESAKSAAVYVYKPAPSGSGS